MWFFRSPEIVFGEDSLSFLSSLKIKKAAIITDRNLLKTEIPDLVRHALGASVQSIVIGDVSEEPPLSEMTRQLGRISEFAPDWFIGLGGGSAIDTAKILFLLYERPDLTAYDITPLVELGLRKKSRLIAIPTTSGTGSECTWAAVLSEEEVGGRKRKHELASREILPDYAILDPSLVISLPLEQTRNTATDAIAHSIEAYGSIWRNPFSDAMAEKALELVVENIEKVINDMKNVELRNRVHIGASMAGLAFSNSQIGLVHALGHALGAKFKLPHGKTVGIFLPYVIHYNYDSCAERYDLLNQIIPSSYRDSRLNLSIQNVLRAIGQATSVKEAGVSKEDYLACVDELVTLASESTGLVTNPKDSSSADLRNLLLRAFET
jgi:alcohol dehydrogenase class IV